MANGNAILWVTMFLRGAAPPQVEVYDDSQIKATGDPIKPTSASKPDELNAKIFRKNPVCFWYNGQLFCR